MRHVSSGLVSLILVGFSIGAAAAQNVCVRAADGAVVCGPVTQDGAQSGAQGDKPNPNPFDQPPQPIAPPPTPALPPAAASTVPNLAARQGERQRLARPATPARPAQVAHRPLPPRELERRPVRPAARDDLRRQAERGRMPPPRGAERGPPPRYAEIDRRRFDRPPPPQQRGERDMARRYDARVRELERELNALRADRGTAMRRGPGPGQQPMYRDRPPPPRYPNRDTRRDEGDRMAAAQRAHRRVEHDGYSDNN